MIWKWWHTSLPWFYPHLLFYLLNSITNSWSFFLRFPFLKWKLINLLSIFSFFVFYFSLTSSYALRLSDWKKFLLPSDSSPNGQGAFPPASCLHAVGYFLSSKLQLVAVFATNKTQTWHANYPCFFFPTLFYTKLQDQSWPQCIFSL